MQHGIECRVPYLDNLVVSLADKMDGNYKLKEAKNGFLKLFLKTVMDKILTIKKKKGLVYNLELGC